MTDSESNQPVERKRADPLQVAAETLAQEEAGNSPASSGPRHAPESRSRSHVDNSDDSSPKARRAAARAARQEALEKRREERAAAKSLSTNRRRRERRQTV